MSFTATCVPGRSAVAAVQFVGSIQHHPTVVIHLDPDRVEIGPPHNRSEWPQFLGFLRELRDSLDNMADILDPQAESEYYRHFVVVSDHPDQAPSPK